MLNQSIYLHVFLKMGSKNEIITYLYKMNDKLNLFKSLNDKLLKQTKKLLAGFSAATRFSLSEIYWRKDVISSPL